IVPDHIVCNRRRGTPDHDAASFNGAIYTHSAVLQRESIESGATSFSRNKSDYRSEDVPSITNLDLRPPFTGNGNGLPSKVDIFNIGSGRDQHSIAAGRDIDGRPDGRLLRRHSDWKPDCDGNLRRRILLISAVVDRAAFDCSRPWRGGRPVITPYCRPG